LILSIDPGTFESAFVLFEKEGTRIVNFAKVKNEILLESLRIPNLDLSLLAIETMENHGMAVGATTYDTCRYIGMLQEAGRRVPQLLIKRSQVKMHICRTMKAKDPNIRQALIDRFGEPGTKKKPGKLYGFSGDCWSALAIGLTAVETITNIQA